MPQGAGHLVQEEWRVVSLEELLVKSYPIKLLALYRFDVVSSSHELESGLWETTEVHGLDLENPVWTLKRIASFDPAFPVGKELKLPQFILTRYGSKVSRDALRGVKVVNG